MQEWVLYIVPLPKQQGTLTLVLHSPLQLHDDRLAREAIQEGLWVDGYCLQNSIKESEACVTYGNCWRTTTAKELTADITYTSRPLQCSSVCILNSANPRWY